MALLQLVPRAKLGSQGLEVSRLGLGCMGMSSFYGPARPEEEMVELIRYVVEQLGVTLLDTSNTYGPFTNEVLIGKVFDAGEKEWNTDCYSNKSSSGNRKRQIMSLLKEKETTTRIEKDAADNKRMQLEMKKNAADSSSSANAHGDEGFDVCGSCC